MFRKYKQLASESLFIGRDPEIVAMFGSSRSFCSFWVFRRPISSFVSWYGFLAGRDRLRGWWWSNNYELPVASQAHWVHLSETNFWWWCWKSGLWNLQPVLQLDVSRFKLRLPWFPSSWVLIWKSSVHVLPRTGTFGCHHFSQPKLNMKKQVAQCFETYLLTWSWTLALQEFMAQPVETVARPCWKISMRWMKLCLPNRTTPSCKMLMSHRSPSSCIQTFLHLRGRSPRVHLLIMLQVTNLMLGVDKFSPFSFHHFSVGLVTSWILFYLWFSKSHSNSWGESRRTNVDSFTASSDGYGCALMVLHLLCFVIFFFVFSLLKKDMKKTRLPKRLPNVFVASILHCQKFQLPKWRLLRMLMILMWRMLRNWRLDFPSFFLGGVHHVFFQTVHVGFVEFDEVAEPAFQTGWVADDDEFAEPPSKTRRITKDMSEEDIAKVKQDRLDRKRANSRAWHAKFESKGATCQPSFCFKGIVSKKSPFPLKLETLGFEVLKSSGSKDGDNETNPEDGEADVANVGADAEGSSPKTLNDARWAFETWQNLVTSLELSTWSDCF